MRDEKNRRQRMKQARKRRVKFRVLGAIILCLLAAAGARIVYAMNENRTAEITIKADEQSILQDEELPQYTVSAVCDEKQQKIVLDKESKYTVASLLKDLDSEKDIKFQKYDGSYVENDFVVSKGKTYYFGSDGRKTVGWQDISGKKYFFTEKGIMDSADWKTDGGNTYYLMDDGSAAVGWLELAGNTYYFDSDAVMLTGTQQIGNLKCVFGDDGKLESKENSVDPNKPMMALTFDDGPGARTHELLDVLEKYDAHATFFIQGIHVSQYASDIQRMKDIGCEIGNHSYDHPQLTGQSDGGAAQIAKTNELLKQACGQSATVLRPPYGSVNDQVKASVGMPMILWNIDTLDWKTKDTQSTIDCVLNTADDGDIVLMHDIYSATVDAALQLIPKLIENGYQLVTVTEMAEARGITLQNGKVYTDFNK